MKSTNALPLLTQLAVLSPCLPSSGTYPYFFLQLIFKQHSLAWTEEADTIPHGSVAGSVQYNPISVSQTPSSAYPP